MGSKSIWRSQGNWHSQPLLYSSISIVEAQLSFVCVLLKNAKFMMLVVLRALTLMDMSPVRVSWLWYKHSNWYNLNSIICSPYRRLVLVATERRTRLFLRCLLKEKWDIQMMKWQRRGSAWIECIWTSLYFYILYFIFYIFFICNINN